MDSSLGDFYSAIGQFQVAIGELGAAIGELGAAIGELDVAFDDFIEAIDEFRGPIDETNGAIDELTENTGDFAVTGRRMIEEVPEFFGSLGGALGFAGPGAQDSRSLADSLGSGSGKGV